MNRFVKVNSLILATCLILGLSFPFEAVGNDDVVAKLKSLGAEFDCDDDGNVIAVDFGTNPLATDADLSLLKSLNHLVKVDAVALKLSNVGLKHLASLSKLKRLHLADTKFTDADVKYLKSLTALEELGLSGTAITDAAIPNLVKLRHLKWINLSFTRVTPKGLRLLRRELPNVYVSESWNYVASIVDGRGVLDTDRATIIFDDIHGPKGVGGGGGSTIQVSKPQNDDGNFSSGGGGSVWVFGKGSAAITVSASRIKGMPTILVGKHRIEIKGEGTEVVVDGQPFRLGSKKIRIIVDTDGFASLEEW